MESTEATRLHTRRTHVANLKAVRDGPCRSLTANDQRIGAILWQHGLEIASDAATSEILVAGPVQRPGSAGEARLMNEGEVLPRVAIEAVNISAQPWIEGSRPGDVLPRSRGSKRLR